MVEKRNWDAKKSWTIVLVSPFDKFSEFVDTLTIPIAQSIPCVARWSALMMLRLCFDERKSNARKSTFRATDFCNTFGSQIWDALNKHYLEKDFSYADKLVKCSVRFHSLGNGILTIGGGSGLLTACPSATPEPPALACPACLICTIVASNLFNPPVCCCENAATLGLAIEGV